MFVSYRVIISIIEKRFLGYQSVYVFLIPQTVTRVLKRINISGQTVEITDRGSLLKLLGLILVWCDV